MARPSARTQPPTKRAARASKRDRRPLSSLLAQLTPETLGGILMETENGSISRYADLCDRMLETDGEIRADYETRISAVSGARQQFEPGRSWDPERDRYAADACAFVEAVVSQIPDFDQAVQDLLDGIGKPFSALQKVWEWDGPGNAFVVRGLEWIHQRRFVYGPEFDLRIMDDGERVTSLGEELDPALWIVHQPRSVAGYPTRGGCLRPCAWPYVFKRWGVQFWVNGAERFAWPFMSANVPRGADADVRAKALEALEQLAADNHAVLDEGSSFKIIESTIKDGGTWKDLVVALNGEISKSILGMTDLSAPSKIGAYGAVEARRGATVNARIALDERALAGTLKSQLCEDLIRFNAHRWPVLPPTPAIRRVVSTSRTPIDKEAMPAARVDEVRAMSDLPPEGGEVGAMFWRDFAAGASSATSSGSGDAAAATRDVAATAFNGAQVDGLTGMLAAVSAGTLAADAAVIAIGVAFPSVAEASARAMVEAQTKLPKPAGGETATNAARVGGPQIGDRGPA